MKKIMILLIMAIVVNKVYGQKVDSLKIMDDALSVEHFFSYKIQKTTFPDTCFIVPEELGKHYLIGGSYRQKSSAINEMRKYMDFGFLPFIIYNGKLKVYRIVIDCPLDSREKAEKDLENIKKLYNIKPWIYSSDDNK